MFVSVDPDRDTPELLSTYLESFDPRIMAATGMKQQIDAMIAGFRAHYRFVPSGESYTVDHTALMFMMDSQGKFVGTIDYHEESGNRASEAAAAGNQIKVLDFYEFPLDSNHLKDFVE